MALFTASSNPLANGVGVGEVMAVSSPVVADRQTSVPGLLTASYSSERGDRSEIRWKSKSKGV